MDIPNARSSHTTPTPRGGGLAVVVPFLLAMLLLRAAGLVPADELHGLLLAGGAVAVVGFLDDHGHVPALWRLVVHFAAAAGLLGLVGPPGFSALGLSVLPGAALVVVAVAYVVWLLNLYNFMDGIDGVAAGEGIAVAGGGALLAVLVGGGVELVLPPLVLMAALAGFLVWNAPPARIFMGDVGSGFVGITLAAFSLYAGRHHEALFWAWLILLGVFVTDATFTLLRRLLRGERVYEAHRSHAYQRAARRVGAHLPVTAAVVAVDLFWLLPIAGVVAVEYLKPLPGLVLAYAPLIAAAAWLGAGSPERTV